MHSAPRPQYQKFGLPHTQQATTRSGSLVAVCFLWFFGLAVRAFSGVPPGCARSGRRDGFPAKPPEPPETSIHFKRVCPAAPGWESQRPPARDVRFASALIEVWICCACLVFAPFRLLPNSTSGIFRICFMSRVRSRSDSCLASQRQTRPFLIRRVRRQMCCWFVSNRPRDCVFHIPSPDAAEREVRQGVCQCGNFQLRAPHFFTLPHAVQQCHLWCPGLRWTTR